MKEIFFKIYAFFFNLRSAFPPERGRVGLVSMHNASFKDGLFEIEKELEKRGGFKFLKISREALKSPLGALCFCSLSAFRLAGAEFIFLNDTFMPLAYAKPNKKTKVIQLWHGQGAFKKFGADIEIPDRLRERERRANAKLDFVFCSSKGVADIYAGAFGVSRERVFATGSPNSDAFFPQAQGDAYEALRESFCEKYPSCKGKHLAIYAPTFREGKNRREGEKKERRALLGNRELKRLKKALNKGKSDEWELLVRLHPQIHGRRKIKGCTDVSDFDNINELCLLSELLISDYSSVCMNFSLLGKPMLFYAPDLEEYERERSFYFPYESYVPGKLVHTVKELCEAAAAGDFESEKNEAFRKFNFDEPDGKASQRAVDILLEGRDAR